MNLPSLYERIGGDAAVRALVDRFYDVMDSDPSAKPLRAMHAKSLRVSRDKLYQFLSGWIGGPPLYAEKYGHPRLRARHAPFPIGEGERDQWVSCMGRALDALGVEGELRTFLDARFLHVATFMINR